MFDKDKLLDWITPYGKRLGDCTGAECRQIGEWFNEVSKAGAADEEIGAARAFQFLRLFYQTVR